MLPGKQIRITGTVQGVGFRPFVWRLATSLNLVGSVQNDAEGLLIQAWGSASALQALIERLAAEPPPLAIVDRLLVTELQPVDAPPGFSILPSQSGVTLTDVSADAATCPACLAEIRDPQNRRFRYAFTNCTQCGPRFSIIRAIPYDRANTSMQAFSMCDACEGEYHDPNNRRFHAQPNCCPACSPHLWLESSDGEAIAAPAELDVIAHASALLKQGAILAVKGLGGFHLVCDAQNESAVAQLRQRKQRYKKPFALMAPNVESIRHYAELDQQEAEWLQSSAAPILLLRAKKDHTLAASVAPGQRRLGFMLPYTPLHHLLMEAWHTPLVMTSGNVSDEAQCIDNAQARAQLGHIVDYFLQHDREIINRLDDSVLQFILGKPQWLRRARGYAPSVLALPPGFENKRPILAMGGELKNTFCLTTEKKAILAQYQGDLENASVFKSYKEALLLFGGLYCHQPDSIAIDAHPDYLSSKLGEQWAHENNRVLHRVQHHHAHVAAAMAEYQLALNSPPVLGIVLDGIGFGADNSLWGGEFLLADYRRFGRLGRIQPVALPGGAQAMKQPWRNAVAHLHHSGLWPSLKLDFPDLPFLDLMAGKQTDLLTQMIEQGINSPAASSAGRLFDAVAALLGICSEAIAYEGEAAMLLEQQAEQAWAAAQAYPLSVRELPELNLHELSWREMWPFILQDLAAKKSIAMIAARFHKTLIFGIMQMVELLQTRHPFQQVVLTGGVMQNRLLASELVTLLAEKGLQPLLARKFPANDGGLALGQAMIALAQDH